MYKTIVLVAILFCMCISFNEASLKVNKCKKRIGSKIKSFEITGCTEYPCVLKKESNPQINITFKLKRRVNGLKPKIAGIVNKRQIPFTVADSKHCEMTIQDAPEKCSLKKGNTYNYSFTLPILKEYPSISVVTKFELTDKRGNSIVCLTFPTKLID